MSSEPQTCAECESRKQHKMPSFLVNSAASTVPIAIFVFALYFYNFHGGLSGDTAVWGQLGDYVGGLLNPFFSFVALLALLYTIRLQSEEMRNSTAELKQSAIALKAQNNLMVRQSIESSFFNLLKVFNDLVGSSVQGFKAKENKGRECFTSIYLELTQSAREIFMNEVDSRPIVIIEKSYAEIYKHRSGALGPYFRMIYNILKFVDEAELSNSDKKFYARIIRAQLPAAELCLIYFSCNSERGREKFLPLVNKYDLLQHLDIDPFIPEECRL